MALPSVRPNPRSSGSATIVAAQRALAPDTISSFVGLINDCQFF